MHVEEETLGLAGSGTVADSHQLNVMFFAQRRHHDGGFSRLAGMRVDGIGGHQFAGAVDYRHFDAGTQARVKTHGGAQAGRCGHQQVMEITGEYVNRFVFRAFAHGAH